MVNHIDGNKNNPHRCNLEWVSHIENIRHAFDTGLIKTQTGCLVLDLDTSLVHRYSSVTEAALAMGVNQSAVSYQLNKGGHLPKLIIDKYLVKLETDETPWPYTERQGIPHKGKYRIDVTYENGRTESYWHVSDFGEKFLGTSGAQRADLVVDKAQRRYPRLNFRLIERTPSRTVQILNLETNEVTETSDITMAETILMKSNTYINKILSNGKTALSGDFAFRIKSDDEWRIPLTNDRRRIKAEVTNVITGVTMSFTSMRTISDETGISRPTIRRCLATNGSFRNFKFKLLEDIHS